jgi:hypothetical protein
MGQDSPAGDVVLCKIAFQSRETRLKRTFAKNALESHHPQTAEVPKRLDVFNVYARFGHCFVPLQPLSSGVVRCKQYVGKLALQSHSLTRQSSLKRSARQGYQKRFASKLAHTASTSTPIASGEA